MKYRRRKATRQCSCRIVPMQPLDEAVRPRMARLRAGVAEAELPAGPIERPVEFGATVGQHPAQRPAGLTIERHQDVAHEGRGIRRRVCGQQPGDAIGARGIARRDLPDLPPTPLRLPLGLPTIVSNARPTARIVRVED